MKMVVEIEQSVGGIMCRATVTPDAGEPTPEREQVNLWAIGAIEIAKASLLAKRWGLNIGAMKEGPLVPEPTPAKRSKRRKNKV